MACQSLKIVPVDMAGGTDVEQGPPTANVGSLDTRNFNALLGHIRKKMHKWRDVLQSWVEKLLKISVFSKSIYRVNIIPIKISIRFLCILILKFVLKTKVANSRKQKQCI